MPLPPDALRAALLCVDVTNSVLRRDDTRRRWLPGLRELLDSELSASGQHALSEPEPSDTLSTMEVASELGRNERWVRRHREQLGAVQHGDRWRYPRAAVHAYTEGANGNGGE
jgi:hypothetical protein